MLLLLDACSMQLVPASAAAVARDFCCCCCLLFDVWVALFFVVIVVCAVSAVLIASISAILGVLQNGKHLQAQRERGLGPISLNPLPLVANRNAEQTKGCSQPTNKTQQNTQSRMTCIPYPWQIETKWLSEVWVRPCPTSLLPASSFDAQPQPVVSPAVEPVAVEPVAVAFCAMISCQLLLPPRPPKRRRTSPDGTQEEAQFHCPQLPSIRSAKCKRNHLESMPREFGFKFVLVNA